MTDALAYYHYYQSQNWWKETLLTLKNGEEDRVFLLKEKTKQFFKYVQFFLVTEIFIFNSRLLHIHNWSNSVKWSKLNIIARINWDTKHQQYSQKENCERAFSKSFSFWICLQVLLTVEAIKYGNNQYLLLRPSFLNNILTLAWHHFLQPRYLKPQIQWAVFVPFFAFTQTSYPWAHCIIKFKLTKYFS